MKFTIEQIDEIALSAMNMSHGSFIYNICLTWRSADFENKRILHSVMEELISKYKLFSESVSIE